MDQYQLGEVTALIATTDEQTARQAKSLFPHSRITRTAVELAKAVQTFQVREGRVLVSDGPSRHEKPIEILVLDIDMPSLEGKEICRTLRDSSHFAPIIVLTSNVDYHLHDALDAGAEDYLLKPFRIEDLNTRVQRLLEQRTEKHRGPKIASMDPPLPHLMEKLHDPRDGHLDARKVADFFGMTLAQLSRLLRRGVSTVHKTPSAPSLQDDLRRFESLASGLLRLTGSERRSRMWLQADNPALDEHAPIELLQMGKIDELATFVQDLLEGRPA